MANGGANIVNLRGNVSLSAKVIKKIVARFIKERNMFTPTYLVIVNEYLTSQICSLRLARSTENAENAFDQNLYPVLICNKCCTQFNHHHMARCNIREVFMYMVKYKDQRPATFKDGKYKESWYIYDCTLALSIYHK